MQVKVSERPDGRLLVVPMGYGRGITVAPSEIRLKRDERSELRTFGKVIAAATPMLQRRLNNALFGPAVQRPHPPRSKAARKRGSFGDCPPCFGGAQGRGLPISADARFIMSVVDAQVYEKPLNVHPANRYLLKGKRP